MACVSKEQECISPRYFDSGSSNQMMGTVSNLQNVKNDLDSEMQSGSYVQSSLE
ncbi:unnamed protein product [Arabis nemorensis]|uniref:Uncharacterized protein n=1 Tax=Arabis nemorensis TaxID=586526 RepID=A0A565B6N8_9BRAS|nr:unnamed protein product [Arabis nemorensis]